MRGGSRKGAGRPSGSSKKSNKEKVGIRLRPWLKSWLKKQPETQAILIETALIEYYQLKPPEKEKLKK